MPSLYVKQRHSSVSVPFYWVFVWTIAAALGVTVALAPLDRLAPVTGGILLIGVALAHPILAAGLAVLSVPAQELITLPGGLSLTQASVLLALGSWVIYTLAHPERRALPGGILPLWGGLLGALALSAGLTAYSVSEAIRETLRWTVAAAIWFIAAGTIADRRHVAYLLACLLIAPAICAAIGLVQFATGDGPPAFRIAPDLPFVRAYGTIGQPNSFAGYLNMVWPLALALAVATTIQAWRTRAARRWILAAAIWGITLLTLAALAASFSRGAWLGAAAGALGLALALGRRALPALLGTAGIAALAIGLALAGVLPEALASRLASIASSLALFDAATVAVTPENFAVVERMAQLQAGWNMFLAAPLSGVGPGNYSIAYPDYAVGAWYSSRGHAHNYYVHMSAEGGIIGLLTYLALIGGALRQAIIALRRATDPIPRSAAIGGCGIIAAVAGHNLFENLHVLNMGIQLAAIWAVLHAIAHATAYQQGSSCAISSPAAPDSSAVT